MIEKTAKDRVAEMIRNLPDDLSMKGILASVRHLADLEQRFSGGEGDTKHSGGNGHNIPIDSFDEEPRSAQEIENAIQMLVHIVWYNRHLRLVEAEGQTDIPPEIRRSASENARFIEEKYSDEQLLPASEFDWGMINGKLSALRWVAGAEWDVLDT